MQSINLAYEWNDVALLTDQRAYTFVCKTMLKIPEQTVDELQEIILADWQYQPEQNEALQFDGSMTLQIGYLCQQQRGELEVKIPLQGELQEPLRRQSSGRLLYSQGQVAGSCLLLEAMLQIPREQQLQRSQVILGQFAMEEMLELPKEWPDMREVLATVAAMTVDEFQIEQQQLKLQGRYQLAVAYENGEQPGERLFAYQQQRPMTAALPVPPGLQELARVAPYYQNLTAQLLDDRHILLAGEGVFCTAEEREPLEEQQADVPQSRGETTDQERFTEQMTEILQGLMAELKRHAEATAQQSAAPKQPEGAEALQQTAAETDCEEVCPAQKPVQPANQPHPSVVNCRGSRRANLSKYMRNLNSSVKTPQSMRNFEFGAEVEQEGEPTPEV